MKVLVTGGLGLVGTSLIPKLSLLGHDVVSLDRQYRGEDLQLPIVSEVQMNTFKPDVVYHLAANASEAKGQECPIDMTQRNVGIFVNVLRACINAGVKKFVYTSSVAVYGENSTPYDESQQPSPNQVYGINKLACEQILKVMAKVYGFDYTIFRPHNIYGPGQDMNDVSRNVVAVFMRKLLENKPYTLIDEGRMRRQFSYVEDVVDVLAQAVDKFSGQTINVGADKDISIKELSDMLVKVSGKDVPIELQPARPQEISMFLADHKLQNSLVTYKDTPLEKGLAKTWAWAKEQILGEPLKMEPEIYVHSKS